MRRLLAFLTIALSVVAVIAATASAKPGVPVDNEPFTLPGALFCGFDVNVGVVRDEERSTTTTLADGTVITRVTGKFIESYTNAETGKTIVRDVSGATTMTVRPDGTSTFVGTNSMGNNSNRLIFGPTSRRNTGEPALVITKGPVVVDFTGNIATGFSLKGRQENVCDLLAAA